MALGRVKEERLYGSGLSAGEDCAALDKGKEKTAHSAQLWLEYRRRHCSSRQSAREDLQLWTKFSRRAFQDSMRVAEDLKTVPRDF